MAKIIHKATIIREDSVGVYTGDTHIEPADPLKALITHMEYKGGKLHRVGRNPAKKDDSPFNIGTKAFITPNQDYECGFYPIWIITTFGMVPDEKYALKEAYEQKLNDLYHAIKPENWPDHFIFPHTHTAYVDEFGNGYTISTDFDSSWLGAATETAEGDIPVLSVGDFRAKLEDPHFTPNEVPWSLPYHTHKVVNWQIQPAAASINVDKLQPKGYYDEDGNWVAHSELDLHSQESQIHGHFYLQDQITGEEDTPEDEGETKTLYVATQQAYGTTFCDVVSIESVNFHMNKDAFLEEGLAVWAPAPVEDLMAEMAALSGLEGKDELVRFRITQILQLMQENEAMAKEYLRPKTTNWLDGMFNQSDYYYDHTFHTHYSKNSTQKIKYNYNQETYEKAAANFDKSTHLLPNLYSFALIEHLKKHGGGASDAFSRVPELQKIITLDIKEDGKLILQPPGTANSGFNFFSMNEYFKLWAKASEKVTDATFTNWWARNAKHTVFDHTGDLLRNQYNDRKDIFPMYSELSIEAKLGPIPSSNPFAPGIFTTNYFANKTSGEDEFIGMVKIDENKSYAIRWLMEKMIDKNTELSAVGDDPTVPFNRTFYRRCQGGKNTTLNDRKVWDMSPFIRCPDQLLNLGEPELTWKHGVGDGLVLSFDAPVGNSNQQMKEEMLNNKLYSEIFLGNMGVAAEDAGMIFSGLTDLIKNAHGHHSSGDNEPSHEGSNKIEKLAGEYFRCMPSVYNPGKRAYSEILFFRIDKYDADSLGFDPEFEEVPEKDAPEILQTYWIPQPLDGALINFVDTQIKYGDSYRYKVFAYSLVTGNQYKYLGHVNNLGTADEFGEPVFIGQEASAGLVLQDSWIWEPSENDGTPAPIAEIVIENRPSVYLMGEPYFDFTTIGIVDDPPLPPDVQIVPYKNVNDKMLFLLNQNFGTTEVSPILIEPEDFEKFLLIYKTQNVNSTKAGEVDWLQSIISAQSFTTKFWKYDIEHKIRFKSDDYIKQYQVFRTEKKPTSYKDFAGFLRQPELELKQDAFVDTLTPNKKYYYIFRAVDIHGNVSNPTAVYEVELVFNSGATYPVIKVVDFETTLTQVKEKPMRRFIHIIPSFAQSKMNLDTYYWGDGPADFDVMGASFGDVFSDSGASNPKKFKIRFTSKSTGRKFDLNLKILHEGASDARWVEYKKKREQEFLMTSAEMQDKKWLEDY